MKDRTKKNTGKSHDAVVKICVYALLAALSLSVSFIERLIVAALPLPMGIKPGLSNIVVMFACTVMGFPCAGAIALIKSGFVFLISGAASGFISLCGGVLSVSAMAILLKIKSKKFSFTGISVICAVVHNFGQLTAASIIAGSALYLSYAPVLLISGAVFGSVTGIILNVLMPVLNKQRQFILKG